MRTNRGCWFRACCSKGVSHYHLNLAETQRQAGEQESLIVIRKKKKEGPGLLWLEVVGKGKLETADQKQTSLCDGFEELIWLSLTSPELKVGAKNRKADRHWPSPSCSGLITAEVVVLLPKLVAVEVVGLNSVVIYSLAIVYYMLSLPVHTHPWFLYSFSEYWIPS